MYANQQNYLFLLIAKKYTSLVAWFKRAFLYSQGTWHIADNNSNTKVQNHDQFVHFTNKPIT